jgi:hypothetical protein
MYQIDNASAATTQPPSSAPGTAGYFTDGNPASNVPATIVPAEWLNSVMMELCNAVTTAGITPDKTKFNQLSSAITSTIRAWIDPTTVLKVANNLSDVASASSACTNIGALQKANNLSDVASKPSACTNIGAVQKAGDTMTGPLVITAAAGVTVGDGTYNARLQGDHNIDAGVGGVGITNKAVNLYNFTIDENGIAMVRSQLNIGTGAAQYVPLVFQSSNGYAPRIQSDGTGKTLSFVNSANTAPLLSVYDATGQVNVPNYLTVGSYLTVNTWARLVSGLWVSGANPPIAGNQGSFLEWNESAANGETTIVNNRGGGSGGFVFRSVNLANTQEIFRTTIDGNGNLSTPTNITAGGSIISTSTLWVQNAQVQQNGNVVGTVWLYGSNDAFSASMTRNTSNKFTMGWDAVAANINFSVDGTFIGFIHQGTSDRALKTNVQPVNPDSPALINQISFHSFDMGEHHADMGVIAQDLQGITKRWVYQAPDHPPWPEDMGDIEPPPDPQPSPLAFDTQALLFDALRSIQQLTDRVKELEASQGLSR